MSEDQAPQRIIVRAVITETGDLHLCPAGLSLLFGVPDSEIQLGMEYPKSWQQAGARRTKEAGAHGCEGLVAVLGYWCAQEYPDAELVVIEQP
ncbi:cupin domain-containing protein [[Mycobacterium] nativiensis]|uniref:Uncharacterized protein n=1 Tax=[Mycobacterium] nativiensis TaxID=2855503 RepID=A0ABU5Y3G7_9MYCO|nr:hypothetical protein [Mycolicibacter sp. MYC340]MEB3034774.1 hypothetical protein [Mycolicibacter sp. MYC340]